MPHEPDVPVPEPDQVLDRLLGAVAVFEHHRLGPGRSVVDQVVAEHRVGDAVGLHALEQVRIVYSAEDHPVDDPLGLQDRRKLQLLRRRVRRVPERREQHAVTVDAAELLDPAEDVAVERQQDLAVGQEEADRVGAPLPHPARVLVGGVAQLLDHLEDAPLHFRAHGRAAVQDPRHGPDSDSGFPGHLANAHILFTFR